MLQQLESAGTQDVSVNDCFKPVSRYWDRINRPEQLITALPEALRILTSPAETGAVTLCLPQDVQAEAFEYPEGLFRKRVWTIARPRPDQALLGQAAAMLRAAKTPLIIAGGGVIYSEATDALARFAAATGVAVVETMAGKGSLPFDHPEALGAVGVTGTPGANRLARDADVVIVVGSRLSDFTTASKTAFQHPDVRFINLNVTEFDAGKHQALPLVGDAKATLEEWLPLMAGWRTTAAYRERVASEKARWEQEVDRIYRGSGGPVVSQAEVIGLVNEFTQPRDVIVNAAGSLPGDLHKLWRARDPKQYHLDYGYSCMGYEIAAGLGVKMAAPDREVYVLVGDGSYLMMAQEIVTSIQERVRLTILVLDNHGFASIGGLSKSVGCSGFATEYRCRDAETGLLDGDADPGGLRRERRVARGARDPCVYACGNPGGARDGPSRRPHDRHRHPRRHRAAGRRIRIVVGRADRRSLDDRRRAGRKGRVPARPRRRAHVLMQVTPHSWELGARKLEA